jgi:hypothetical protein
LAALMLLVLAVVTLLVVRKEHRQSAVDQAAEPQRG